jgi:hypothetical protein
LTTFLDDGIVVGMMEPGSTIGAACDILIATQHSGIIPPMIVILDSKRRLTVPAALAPASPGDYFDARFDAEEDAIVFRRLAGKEDWLTVLKECPVSMDDIPARRRETSRRRKL